MRPDEIDIYKRAMKRLDLHENVRAVVELQKEIDALHEMNYVRNLIDCIPNEMRKRIWSIDCSASGDMRITFDTEGISDECSGDNGCEDNLQKH